MGRCETGIWWRRESGGSGKGEEGSWEFESFDGGRCGGYCGMGSYVSDCLLFFGSWFRDRVEGGVAELRNAPRLTFCLFLPPSSLTNIPQFPNRRSQNSHASYHITHSFHPPRSTSSLPYPPLHLPIFLRYGRRRCFCQRFGTDFGEERTG